jgi:hypothetical protein
MQKDQCDVKHSYLYNAIYKNELSMQSHIFWNEIVTLVRLAAFYCLPMAMFVQHIYERECIFKFRDAFEQ